MGFLRKLAGHILDGVGTVIEVIGTVTHIEPIADLGLSISIKGYELQDDLDLDNISTSVQETIDVHKMCEDVRLQADAQAKGEEDSQVHKLHDDIDEFSQALSAVLPEEVIEYCGHHVLNGIPYVGDRTAKSSYCRRNHRTDVIPYRLSSDTDGLPCRSKKRTDRFCC